ncbi:ATP-binding cassette domain-containing protein [Cohnella sp. WQ 127256]|uniref:ATP-binding cassette domain-containing protein n=1 Tax=Cohnella sp. WQ 127256 TaxID=2938790 RepID=UPI002119A314|nr:ATP-binding cassette domain-containing protein [Cohnella sp. WQ 127256]
MLGTKVKLELDNNPEPIPLILNGMDWCRLDEAEGERVYNTSDLRLEPGTITLLMGPNGAGKTTLLEMLAGLRPPEGLQVTYGLEPLWQSGLSGRLRLNEKALRQYSYACQSPEEGLFARSVKDELNYSLRPYNLLDQEREERRHSALAAVGWETSWELRDPYLMSGGERRRCAIASVFVTPAPWVFLDEPTAGLDGAGHDTVAMQLVQMKKNGKGIVMVSHDSDWALPMADHVMLLRMDGSIGLCSREKLLVHPEWLEETGMKVPDWLQMAHWLWCNGADLANVCNPLDAAEAWNPNRLAGQQKVEQQAQQDQQQDGNRQVQLDDNQQDQSIEKLEEKQLNEQRQMATALVRKVREQRFKKDKSHRLTGFDPRSIWLAYVLVSTGLFLLNDWISIGLGAIVVGALLTIGRVSLRRWRGLIVNYAVFSVITSVIFAWGASGSGMIEWEAFTGTLFTFTRTMLILLLGLAIPLVMSPLSLRRSLEQLIMIRGTIPQWAQRFILTVTLMMRFVPVLLELWERFTRIFLARGKTMSRNPVAIGKKLRDVSIPFLLALFRLGDEVVLALESRGVGFNRNPTRAVKLMWKMRDYGAVAGALALAIGLWGLANR